MTELITTGAVGAQKVVEFIPAKVAKGSAFQSVVPQGTITIVGKIKKALKIAEGQNFSVEEGGKKTVLKSEFGEIVVLPSKKSFVVVSTDEGDEAMAEVASIFERMAPGVFAQEFDYNVAGLKADNNAGGIKALTASTVSTDTEVANASDIKVAYGALTATGDMPSAVVLSSALFGDLISLDATETDRKISNEILTNGTMLGLPVKTFRSAQKIGFIRDFSRDEWALKDDKVTITKATAGNITDSLGVKHNLTQDGKKAWIMDGFYSFYADPENATVVLRPVPEV